MTTINLKGAEDVLTIQLPGFTAVRIDVAARVVAVDGRSGHSEPPFREPGWRVLDLRDGIYSDFHRLNPADSCFDAVVCAGSGQHDVAEVDWPMTDSNAAEPKQLPQYTCEQCGETFGTNCTEDDIACPECEAIMCPHCKTWFGGD